MGKKGADLATIFGHPKGKPTGAGDYGDDGDSEGMDDGEGDSEMSMECHDAGARALGTDDPDKIQALYDFVRMAKG